MIILEKPYVSSLLKQTIINKQIPVLQNDMLKGIQLNGEFNAFKTNDLLNEIKDNKNLLVYSNSENSIQWINKHLSHTNLPDTIDKMKDKFRFRESLQPLYPNLKFKKTSINEIDSFEHNNNFPFIFKPTVGFLSMGIYRVNNQKEWEETKEDIKKEILRIKDLFPIEVMNLSEFIIEDIIEGEEFAIDVYYKGNGKPVILNIFKHLFSSEKDVSDRSYHTSKEIIETHLDHFTGVLAQIGRLLNLKSFPMHIEMRLDKDNELVPIESNPMRFAGWCMTDMAYYAYDINPYEYYFDQKEPDWDTILKDKEGKIYYVTIADIAKNVSLDKIETVDYESFLSNFSRPLELRKTDFNNYPIFAFMFSETTKDNFQEIEKMLNADLSQFINMKN